MAALPSHWRGFPAPYFLKSKQIAPNQGKSNQFKPLPEMCLKFDNQSPAQFWRLDSVSCIFSLKTPLKTRKSNLIQPNPSKKILYRVHGQSGKMQCSRKSHKVHVSGPNQDKSNQIKPRSI